MIALHISHTDIRQDSRILKEMDSLGELDGLSAIGIGIAEDNSSSGDIRAVRNFSRGARIRPAMLARPVRMLALLIVYLRLLVKSCATRADVVQCHDWFVLPIGAFHSMLWSSKLIYDAHELESDTNTSSRFRKRMAFWIERLFWWRIKGFITVSGSIMDWYSEKFGGKDCSALVLNAPVIRSTKETTEPAAEHIDIRGKYGIDTSKSLGVYVGMLETGRGLDMILEAVSRIPEQTHVVFIGYGPYGNVLQEKAARMGCTNVTFIGRVPHDMVVPYIRDCDYGLCLIDPVSLSDIYSLPNKLFEYVNAGLHVFGSDLPEIRRFLEGTRLGAVIGSSAEELCEAIENLEVPRSAGAGNRTPEEYRWAYQAERLRELYEQVIEAV